MKENRVFIIHAIIRKAVAFLAFVTTAIIVSGLDNVVAAARPAKPVISLEQGAEDNSVKITINETERAEGYLIYMKSAIGSKYKKIKTLKKNGTAVRTYTVKNLEEGDYSFKVKAYLKEDGKTIKGSYSKVKSISLLSDAEVDYADGSIVSKIEKLISKLVKKYPKYSEKEIRCLAATANMDLVKDNEVYTIFNANSKQELEEMAKLFDNLMDEEYENMKLETLYNSYEGKILLAFEDYKKQKRRYDNMIKINELFVDEDIKKQANFVFNETDTMITQASLVSTDYLATPGTDAGINIGAYLFNDYHIIGFNYNKTNIYKYDDKALNGTAAGYVINRYAVYAALGCVDRESSLSMPNGHSENLIERYRNFRNPISEYIKKSNTKVKE